MTSSPAIAYPRTSSAFPLSKRSLHYTLLRPSIRLKATLYSLLTIIALLVLLALNAAHTPDLALHPTDPAYHLNTSPSPDTPADSVEGLSEAAGQDAKVQVEELQRSFEEPDFELLNGIQPNEIGCDVPLDGNEGQRGVLLFLGIFSTADRKDRRDLYVDWTDWELMGLGIEG
jgi:hypothetical protein